MSCPTLAAATLALSAWAGIAVAQQEIIADGACIAEGTVTFCHELRHIRTIRAMLPPAVGSSGPPVVRLGFNFEGQRSCRSADGEVVAGFRLTMHGVSEPAVADYPDLMAQILPGPAELERYRIGDLVDIIVAPQAGSAIDPAVMSSAFGFDGLLLPDGTYVMIEYVPVAKSFAACLAHE